MRDVHAPKLNRSGKPGCSLTSVDRAPLDLAIVILNYNTVDLLRECLRSLQASRHDLRARVCVVDNASTDASAAMVRAEFPAVQLIVNPANRGYSAGNNVGLRWFGFGGSPAASRLRCRATHCCSTQTLPCRPQPWQP